MPLNLIKQIASVNGCAASMAGTSGKRRRSRGHIRRRDGSFQVLVYAGVDPLTGKDHYLTESTHDEGQAQKILTRLLGAVDEQRNPRTKTTLGAALDAWMRTHEAEETTLDDYRGYLRRTAAPALGKVALAKFTPQEPRHWPASWAAVVSVGASAWSGEVVPGLVELEVAVPHLSPAVR